MWGILKKDSISEAVAKIQAEALKGDQHKLDKNKNGKLDKEDFKKLRKEETEVLDEATVASVAKAHGFEKVKTGFEKGSYKHPKTGETITPLRGGQEYGHSRKDGSTVSAFNHKSSLEGHLAKHGYKKTTSESVEQVEEGWDDMLKYVKDKNGPQPNGGSGKKQGTRYGGGKQKEDESEKRKEKNESTEVELDEMIAEVLKASDEAGKWIGDFVKSDNPKFAGKSPEKRKQMALAAYYAAQKKESTNYDEFIELDEEVQGEIVKTSAKEIKHANVKDKLNDQEVMEPNSEGEANFLDKHSIEVTDDPARDGHKTGTDKLKHATEPKGNGAGKYNGKDKTGVKESTDEEISSEDHSAEESIDEGCGGAKAKGKKTFSSFKKQMNSKG